MASSDYPRRYGDYLLLENLGKGGMSHVDMARRGVADASYVRFLVIKRIHPHHAEEDSFVRMFQDEARINSELQHENIAQVYDFGRMGDEYFLAMEYIPGMDLRDLQHTLAARSQILPMRVSLRVLADVLAGLDYAHSRVDTYGRSMNIVHRDVNPRNIMLSIRGEVKLIDFGVAKAEDRIEKTTGHVMKGKFAYMAPEQIEARRNVDGRADLFAMGLMFHELLAGRSPLAGLTEVQLMHRILSGRIPKLQVHEPYPDKDALQAIQDRAIALDPDMRYPTAGDMRMSLIEAAKPLGGLPTQEELAQFIQSIDPERTKDITDRLESYRELHSLTLPTSTTATSTEVDKPIDLHSQPTMVSGQHTITLSAPRSALLGLVLVGVLSVLGAGGVLWWAKGPIVQSPSEATSAPTFPQEDVRQPGDAAVFPTEPEKPDSEATPAPRRTAPKPRVSQQKTASSDQPTGASPPEDEPQATEATEQDAQPTDPVATDVSPDPTAKDAAIPEGTGFLYLSSRPHGDGFEVRLDGELLGLTPLKRKELPVGIYSLRVVDRDSARSWTVDATIEKDMNTKVQVAP